MKRVLILCDMFPPAFGPRMGYLCKYLRRSGWIPVVLAEYVPDETFVFLKEDTEAHYIRYYRARTAWGRKLEWVGVFLLDVLFGYKDLRMRREALRLTQRQSFRLILCSAYRTFPLPAAHAVARKTNLPLAVDLRDIIEQSAGNEFISHTLPKFPGKTWIVATFLKRTLKQRNRVLRAAACLTTVSPWHVDCLKSVNPRVKLIYNGYDPEIFYPAPRRSERFYITYTGRIIHLSLRDPELFFRAVARLVMEKVISPETFCIRWFTDEKSRQLICRETEKYALASYTECHDYVPASRVPALLNESAILLLLSNKTGEAGPKGVMTTKFFEALAVERPILCVRGDEGCLEEAILRTHAGLSAHNEEEVYRFIITCYRRWQLTGETGTEIDRNEVEKFSRKAQADQFIRMFEEIIDNR